MLDTAQIDHEKSGKIWQEVPYQLRELLKIFLSGFNVYFFEKTGKRIDLNISNHSDGFTYDFSQLSNNSDESVQKALDEYFHILKSKIQEGARTGIVMPNMTSDSAELLAQIQSVNFAQHLIHVKNFLNLGANVKNKDLYGGILDSIDEIDNEFKRSIINFLSINRQLEESKSENILLNSENIRLNERSELQRDEIDHRREEAKIRAAQPLTIAVSQNVIINQNIGDDFSRLRNKLYKYLDDPQRQEAIDLEKEIDKVADSPNPTTDQKRTLAKRAKRWVESVKETIKIGKEAKEVGADLLKGWDKFKEFADKVLDSPQLHDSIQGAQDLIQQAMNNPENFIS
jgi:uncharacterized protein YdiU (UPF0061 family)